MSKQQIVAKAISGVTMVTDATRSPCTATISSNVLIYLMRSFVLWVTVDTIYNQSTELFVYGLVSYVWCLK